MQSKYKKVIQIFQVSTAAKETCTSCFKGELKTYGGQKLTNVGCCSMCSKHGGYLVRHYSDKDIKKIRKDFDWDKDKGFLGDEGCKLPYTIRSGVCIGFMCLNLESALAKSGVSSQQRTAIHNVWIDEEKRKYK